MFTVSGVEIIKKLNFLFISFVLLLSKLGLAQEESLQKSPGQEIYESSCLSCHGQDGLGSQELKTPKLASQFDWYLQTQLEAFKSKVRPYKNGATCSENLSASQIKELSTYLSKL